MVAIACCKLRDRPTQQKKTKVSKWALRNLCFLRCLLFLVCRPAAGLTPEQIRPAQLNALETAFLSEEEKDALRSNCARLSSAHKETEVLFVFQILPVFVAVSAARFVLRTVFHFQNRMYFPVVFSR